MAVLLPIGLIHAYAIWYGDILVQYAVAGAIVFPAWRWRPATLLYAAFMLILASTLMAFDNWWGAVRLHRLALMPQAEPAIVAHWAGLSSGHADTVAANLAGYRGSLAQVAAMRWQDALTLQRDLPVFLIDTMAMAILGIALLRLGYFTGWSGRTHRIVLAIGYGLGLPVMAGLAAMILAGGFDPLATRLAGAIATPLTPLIVLGHGSAVVLIVRSGIARHAVARLAAAGRMALTNYLATSVISTTIFYGTGLGLFGHLDRAALYVIVPPIWLATFLWSKVWLDRFAHGPVEWVWRTIASARLQKMRRIDVASNSQ